eukprot:9248309-Pyramimonas_sp.AAC.2
MFISSFLSYRSSSLPLALAYQCPPFRVAQWLAGLPQQRLDGTPLRTRIVSLAKQSSRVKNDKTSFVL